MAQHIDIPTRPEIAALLDERDPASVSIYLPTSPLPQDADADRIEFKNLAAEAVGQLEAAGADRAAVAGVREEAIEHGTREGTLRGLAVTGAVITGAGIVLAGTFGALAVLPLVSLTEIGFVVAFGVLLDTFIVRSVIVPALVIDIGRRVWWPSRLSRSEVVDR